MPDRVLTTTDALFEMFREHRLQDEAHRRRNPAPAPAAPPSLFRVVSFAPVRWAELVEGGRELDRYSDEADNTRRWSPTFNLAGIVGEAVYADVADLPFSIDAKLARVRASGLADGGEDFPGVDVKGTPYRPPFLKHTRALPMKAPFYALAHVDLDRQRGQYVGYATAAELDAAPDRDFGHGPARTLEPSALARALPPVR